MKKLSKLLLLFALYFVATTITYAQPVQVNGDLSVNGNKIVNEHGQAVSFAGPSLFWSQWEGGRFYNSGCVNWLINDWNATIVRAAMGVEDSGGYISDPSGNEAKVRAVVQAAIDAGIYVIIDWHSHYADHNTGAAVDFFRRMAQDYGSYDNVIFEIWNEPKDDRSWQNIKDYAAQVIPAIRNTGSDNIIVVGTTHWGQNVRDAANSPISGWSNIAYTLHFYAASHKDHLRNEANYALSKNIALFITEWGVCEYTGNGYIDEASTNAWMDWARTNQISHCNWSICDKGESASALYPSASSTGNWSDGDLRQSGHMARAITRDWCQNCNECNVVDLPAIIQAENFCSKTGTIQTEPCGEGGTNIGYWGAGDHVAYKVNAPQAGNYVLTLRYATQSTGKVAVFESDNGNVTINLAQTSTNPDNWQVYEDITATVSLPQGESDIRISSPTGLFNLNWFNLEDEPCIDFNLNTIEITPENETIIQGESIQLTATGYSTCQELPINPVWSANAPNGLFTGNTLGTFNVTATDQGITGSTSVTVVEENATIISNSEYDSGVSLMNTNWFSYSDQNVNGASIVQPIVPEGESLPPYADGANNTNKSTRITYTLDKGAWEYDPFVGFGFSMTDPEAAYDLSGSTGISFWHKGASCALMVPLATNTDEDYYQANVPLHADWTKVIYTWDQLAQSSEWGNDIPWDASQILKFQWQVTGSTGDQGEVLIDQVKIENLVFETPLPPDPCPTPEILASIIINPDEATIGRNELLGFTVSGINVCEQVIAVNPTFSPNAPGGQFSSPVQGVFEVIAYVDGFSDTAIVTVLGNLPPIANAGPNATIEQPVSSISLAGSGTDPEQAPLTYQWTQVSGPANSVIQNSTSPVTLVTGLVNLGDYVFQLIVNDGETNSLPSQCTITVEPQQHGQTLVEKHGQLNVNGNRIVGKNGENVGYAGISWYWTEPDKGNPTRFYNAEAVKNTTDHWKNAFVRLAISTGEYDPGNDLPYGWMNNPDFQRGLIRTMVEAAVANGVYVIIDWHAHFAHLYENQAYAFFDEMAREYGHLDNVIFEIYNEPKKIVQNSDENTPWWRIKQYAEHVIPAIRNHSDNLIICGTPFWSQRVDEASSDPLADANTCYAWHFYDAGWHDFNTLTGYASTAMNNGVAVFASEWGYWKDTDDHSQVQRWIDFMKSNEMNWCAWEFHDNSEPSSFFNGGASSTGPWSDGELDHWGRYLKPQIIGYNGGIECNTHQIANRLEAEKYCQVTGAIQKEACGEGGENLGYWEPGNYASYQIYVPVAGDYQVKLRYATQSSGKNAIFEGPGVNVTYNLAQTSADPNNWQVYADITKSVYLPAGEHEIKISSKTGLFNLNYIDFGGCNDDVLSSIEISPASITINLGEQVQFSAKGYSSCQEVPINETWSANAPNGLFTGTTKGAFTVSATDQGITGIATVIVDDIPQFDLTIQAEDYTFAADGIQTEPCQDVGGGLNVGYTEPGRWMAYNGMINIPVSGQYLVEFRVASNIPNAVLRFERDAGAIKYPELTIDVNKGWQGWETRSQVITLDAGTFDYGIACVTGGWNINWFRISTYTGASQKAAIVSTDEDQKLEDFVLYPNPANSSITIELLTENNENVEIYSIAGTKVLSETAISTVVNFDISNLEKGLYLVKVGNKTKRLVKK